MNWKKQLELDRSAPASNRRSRSYGTDVFIELSPHSVLTATMEIFVGQPMELMWTFKGEKPVRKIVSAEKWAIEIAKAHRPSWWDSCKA